MWRAVRASVGSALCFLVVMATLVAIDARVYERLSLTLSDASAHWTDRLADLAAVVVRATREQSVEHAPLLLFTVAAAVLLLLMLRS